MVAALVLPALLFAPPGLVVDTTTAPVIFAQDPAESAPPPTPTSTTPDRFNQWSLQVLPGFEYISLRAGDQKLGVYGPNMKLGAWVHSWRGNFMVGGGTSVHYTFLIPDDESGDKLHFATLDGDLLLGGGKPDKIVGYGHLFLGAGVLGGKDGQTDTKILLPGIRAGAGGGAYGFVTEKISLGGLVNFGWYSGLGIDAYLTLGLHFGRKEKT